MDDQERPGTLDVSALHGRKSRSHQIAFLGAILMGSLWGCRRTPNEDELPLNSPGNSRSDAPTSRESAQPRADYDVPIRTDAELRTLFRQTCDAAEAANKPLLLNAGAAWCGDCRLLARIAQEEPLRSELSHFAQVSVNLGEDAHEWLRTAFKIHGIARWIVFRPSDCQSPVESWKPLHSRVVEPASNGNRTNAEALVAWLAAARAG